MRILISNDDGYQAKGLSTLVDMLSSIADVNVVAPDRNRSGASNSLTLEYPIRASRAENGYIKVDGTPTDCVHLAITGLLDHEPDMVVSGVNAGSNLGDDVLYSGTVAAAMEGRFLGFPAIAISNVSHEPQFYDTSAKVAAILVKQLIKEPLPADTILNVNVPDCAYEDLQGYQATRLGHRHKSEPVVQAVDPRGRPIFWVGPAGKEQDAGVGTDFHAVRNGFISITPLQVDLTCYKAIDNVSGWLKGING